MTPEPRPSTTPDGASGLPGGGPRARSFERAHWEWALDEAHRAGRPFSCAVMVIDNLDGLEPARRAEWATGFMVDLERLIEERRGERKVLFGVEDDRAYLALLDCDVTEAGRFSGEIIRATYPLTGFLPSPKPGLSVGIASTQVTDAAPDASLTLETLLRVAAEGAEVAVAGGGGRWVHTELYGLVQRRLDADERAQPLGAPAGVALPEPEPEPEPVPEPVPEPEPEPVREPEPAPPRVVPRTTNGSPDPEPGGRSEPVRAPADGEPAEPGEPGGDEGGWREILPVRTRPDPAELSARGELPGLEAPVSDRDVGLVEVLFSALGQVGLTRTEVNAAERVLLPLLSDYVRTERARSREESKKRVQLLERRIQKLRAQLEQVERAAPPPVPEESGLASTFRAVQGLSPTDGQYELKSSLLEAILHANLELAACSARRQ